MTLVLRTEDWKNEGNDFGWTMARLVGEDGIMLVTADVLSVAVYVFDESTPGAAAIYSNTAIAPADVIFDSPQRDRRWTLPDEGYTFAHYLSAATVFGASPGTEKGNHVYALEYRITTTPTNASGTIWVIRRVKVAAVRALRA
jgi:hypothetical protein